MGIYYRPCSRKQSIHALESNQKHAAVQANYLASPPLVVAYALAGRVDIDFDNEPLGIGASGPVPAPGSLALPERLQGPCVSPSAFAHAFCTDGPRTKAEMTQTKLEPFLRTGVLAGHLADERPDPGDRERGRAAGDVPRDVRAREQGQRALERSRGPRAASRGKGSGAGFQTVLAKGDVQGVSPWCDHRCTVSCSHIRIVAERSLKPYGGELKFRVLSIAKNPSIGGARVSSTYGLSFPCEIG